jgi:hypothetical protein
MNEKVFKILSLTGIIVLFVIGVSLADEMPEGAPITGKVAKINASTNTIIVEVGRGKKSNTVEVKVGNDTPVETVIVPENASSADTAASLPKKYANRAFKFQLIKLSDLKEGDTVRIFVTKVEAAEVLKVPEEMVKQAQQKAKNNKVQQ